jgi:transcriptional regulator with XRE-family HTH domain
MVSIRQVKAARALLGWSQEDLAARSGISYPTVARLESQDGVIGGRADTATKILDALEKAGVVFLAPGVLLEGGPGVRLHVTPNEALTDEIKALEGQLARPDPDLPPSPEAGMHQLERARKQNVVTKLKNRRTKLTKNKQ